jgi:hypothetical protein
MSPPWVAGGIVDDLVGIPVKATAKVALTFLSGWIVAGAQEMLAEVVKAISLVSTPSLTSSWFSAGYWRIAGLALLLTVPFLFAAAVQAVVRSDLGILLRAAFVDLPVAVLSVTLTAPLIGLLLAATDEMCAVVTGGGTAGGSFLTAAAGNLNFLHNGFMLLVIALVMLLAGLVLMVELIMRAAAIYIVVLFLPLGFAAMVWPARRVWIKRMIELLIALILSKFARVAVLSLAVSGIASFGAGETSLGTAVTAMALMVLAAFSPWALLRLLPFTEIAAGHGSMLSQEGRQAAGRGAKSGVNTLALAMDPVAAGFNALDNLVRSSATSAPAPGDDGGRVGLGRGLEQSSARPSRSGAAGPEGADESSGGDVASPAGPHQPAGGGMVSPAGLAPPTGQNGAGFIAFGAPVREAPAIGAAAADPQGGGGEGSADRLASAGPSSGRSGTDGSPLSPDPGLLLPVDEPSARPAIADEAAVLHPDNAQRHINLRGNGEPFMTPPEGGRRGAQGPLDSGDGSAGPDISPGGVQ